MVWAGDNFFRSSTYAKISTLIFVLGLYSANGQAIAEDNYCTKLKMPVSQKLFGDHDYDSLLNKVENENHSLRVGKLLSRFDEEVIVGTNKNILRLIQLNGFLKIESTIIFTVEKKDTLVAITIKGVDKIKDSTFQVNKKFFSLNKWNELISYVKHKIIDQPKVDRRSAVHDGGTAILECNLENRYHYVSLGSDPEKSEIFKFFFQAMGPIFMVRCKNNMRN